MLAFCFFFFEHSSWLLMLTGKVAQNWGWCLSALQTQTSVWSDCPLTQAPAILGHSAVPPFEKSSQLDLLREGWRGASERAATPVVCDSALIARGLREELECLSWRRLELGLHLNGYGETLFPTR